MDNPKESFISNLLGFAKKINPFRPSITEYDFRPQKASAIESIEPATTTQAIPPRLDQYSFDRDDFRKRIAYNETRSEREPYRSKSRIAHKDGTHDWGKYQINESSLREWSPHWLEKEYDVESFLNNPNAQEQFFDEYMNVAEAYKLTPEEAAIMWHRGWGVLGTGKPRAVREKELREYLDRQMADPDNYKYLNTFRNVQ